MTKVIIAFTFAFFANMTLAAAHPCYGKKEERLARTLLKEVPYLKLGMEKQQWTAKRLREETCTTIAFAGRLVDIDYAYEFYRDSRNRSIIAAAERRKLNPLLVQAAIVDRLWPPKLT
jgi:hypothetical protein